MGRNHRQRELRALLSTLVIEFYRISCPGAPTCGAGGVEAAWVQVRSRMMCRKETGNLHSPLWEGVGASGFQ